MKLISIILDRYYAIKFVELIKKYVSANFEIDIKSEFKYHDINFYIKPKYKKEYLFVCSFKEKDSFECFISDKEKFYKFIAKAIKEFNEESE